MTRVLNPPKWNTDCYPEKNTVVWVWAMYTQVKAIWTGTEWRTPDGVKLQDVTHWRAYKN